MIGIAIVAGAVIGIVLVSARPAPSPGGGSGLADLLAPRSLDPAAPSFPLPDGATLENAFAEGDGPAAYRIASWTSPLGFDATVAFYAKLDDSRWQASGQPQAGLAGTTFRFADKRAVFAYGALSVAATSPVRIAVRFVPPGTLPGPSQEAAAASPIAFGTLPPATIVPAGLPSWAIPRGASLVDAAGSDSASYGIFDVRGDVTSVRQSLVEAIQEAGLTATVGTSGDQVIIRVGSGSDMIVLQATDGGVRVSVAVTP